jgi:phage FluMu protein Com
MNNYHEERCPECGKLLCKMVVGVVEIKCPRCNYIATIERKPNIEQSDLIATK